MVCAGAIVDLLKPKYNQYELTDSAISAQILYNKYKRNILNMLQECEHGKYLISLGFEDDLKFCAQLNVTTRIPELQNGVLR